MAPTSIGNVPQNAATAQLLPSTATKSGNRVETAWGRPQGDDETHDGEDWGNERAYPYSVGYSNHRFGRSNGELKTIIRRPEDYQPHHSRSESPDTIHSTPLVIDCGGYRLSDVLLPTSEYTQLRKMLKDQENPFEDLTSVKITIYSDQPGRSFKPRQLRIRSGKGSKPYTLVHVVELLAKSLVKGPDATIDCRHLPHWYLDTIVREARGTTFRCSFRNCGSSRWEEAQRMGLAQFAARHDTWDRKKLEYS